MIDGDGLRNRLFTAGWALLIVILSFFSFHVADGSPVEQGIWVFASLCFVQLSLVLAILTEQKEHV